MEASGALVLFSGGQDSTVCLAWALERFERVETIGFDYGQRHRVELECRQTVLSAFRTNFPVWGERLGQDHMVDLGVLGQISETALTQETAIAFNDSGLPNTFVPGRNLIFFCFAGAVAYRRNLSQLVGGMCETDFSGYPDCRNETLQALGQSLNLGMEYNFEMQLPLMWLDKAATWALSDQLGGPALVDLIIDATHTCYLGAREPAHAWGRGCGTCPACELRAAGFATFHAAQTATQT